MVALGTSLADQFPSGFLVLPRVRLSADVTLRTYDFGVTSNVRRLAAVFDISKSPAHRTVDHLTPRLAGLLDDTVDDDRRRSWTVGGTLSPTRDHAVAEKSKNYRYFTNAQILSRQADLLVIAVHGGGPGNRNDPVRYQGSPVQRRCLAPGRVLADGGYRGVAELHTPVFAGGRIVRDDRWRRHRRRRARAERCIARRKDWQILCDYRRHGRHLPETLRAVAYLHNLRILMPAMG